LYLDIKSLYFISFLAIHTINDFTFGKAYSAFHHKHVDFFVCCAAYLYTEIKTRPKRAQTVDFCIRYARKTAKIGLPFTYGIAEIFT